jgi:hypothetical protein
MEIAPTRTLSPFGVNGLGGHHVHLVVGGSQVAAAASDGTYSAVDCAVMASRLRRLRRAHDGSSSWCRHLDQPSMSAVNPRCPPRLPAAIVHALPLAQGPLRGLGDEVFS